MSKPKHKEHYDSQYNLLRYLHESGHGWVTIHTLQVILDHYLYLRTFYHKKGLESSTEDLFEYLLKMVERKKIKHKYKKWSKRHSHS